MGPGGEKEELLLDLAGSLHSYGDLLIASVLTGWGDGSNIHVFPDSLELDALDPEALGLQASYMWYCLNQTFYPA